MATMCAGRQPSAVAKVEPGVAAIGPVMYKGGSRVGRQGAAPRRQGVGPSVLIVTRNRVILK